MMWSHDWNGGWVWVVMPITMLVFWSFVIWAVVALIRSTGQGRAEPSFGPGPEQVLGERYARGEIDEAEYEHRLATLRGRTRAPS